MNSKSIYLLCVSDTKASAVRRKLRNNTGADHDSSEIDSRKLSQFSIAFLTAAWLSCSPVNADTVISSDTTQNGGTFSITPPSLIVTGLNNPRLTLTNGAVTSGIQNLIAGNLAGESGRLEILNGSAVTNSGSARLAYGTDSTGSALVSGAGSSWINHLLFVVGRTGKGELRIEDGGSVSITTVPGSSPITYIGALTGSEGLVTVSGVGSQWTSGVLSIGEAGRGELRVEAGGTVLSESGDIGFWTGTGKATVTGAGSHWTNIAGLTVGTNNKGELLIEKGGSVSGAGYIGLVGGSEGNVVLTDRDTHWDVGGELVVGQAGKGTLRIEAGATLSGGGYENLETGFIGKFDISEGSVTVTGENSLWTNEGSLVLGGSSLTTQTTGTGSLEIVDGGSVIVGGTLRIHGGGRVDLKADSTLQVQHLNATNGTFNFTAGTLIVDGIVTGNLDVPSSGEFEGNGFVLGNLSNHGIASSAPLEMLKVTGSFEQGLTGTLVMEIGGKEEGNYDILDVDGNMALAGKLEITQWNGFMPAAGDEFQLFSFGSISGNFDSIAAFPLEGGLSWDYSRLTTAGVVSVVPKPSGILLLCIGFVVLFSIDSMGKSSNNFWKSRFFR